MREILFRGKRVDNGEWVYGDLITKPIHHECVILENGCINHSVIPETVGQYTGRNDVNGKKIFEGDMIRRFTGYEFETRWREYRLGEINQARAHGYDWHDTDEIIGNIHENPELLTPHTH